MSFIFKAKRMIKIILINGENLKTIAAKKIKAKMKISKNSMKKSTISKKMKETKKLMMSHRNKKKEKEILMKIGG